MLGAGWREHVCVCVYLILMSQNTEVTSSLGCDQVQIWLECSRALTVLPLGWALIMPGVCCWINRPWRCCRVHFKQPRSRVPLQSDSPLQTLAHLGLFVIKFHISATKSFLILISFGFTLINYCCFFFISFFFFSQLFLLPEMLRLLMWSLCVNEGNRPSACAVCFCMGRSAVARFISSPGVLSKILIKPPRSQPTEGSRALGDSGSEWQNDTGPYCFLLGAVRVDCSRLDLLTKKKQGKKQTRKTNNQSLSTNRLYYAI